MDNGNARQLPALTKAYFIITITLWKLTTAGRNLKKGDMFSFPRERITVLLKK